MIIYGRNSIREAVAENQNLEKIFIKDVLSGKENQEVVEAIKKSGIEYKFVPKAFLDKKCGNDNHQGFVAEVAEFEYSSIEDMFKLAESKNEQVFLCILEGIEDPHNLGSIIRTCECAGVHGIIIEKNRACNVNSTVIKVSSGASAHMKIAKVSNIPQTIEKLKQQGVWVFSVELGGGLIYSTNLKGNLALVIGSEGRGTRKIVKEKCDGVISLPMFGVVNSLNASNATAIALYEAIRQRKV